MQVTFRLESLLMFAVFVFLAPTAAAERYGIGPCDGGYARCLANWKSRRLSFLKSEHGYLNLAGLFWLEAGRSSFGSAPTNDVVFPDQAPAEIGTFTLADGRVRMRIDRDVTVRVDGEAVADVLMRDDTTENFSVATHADLAWTVIRRDNSFAVRLRDFSNPLLTSFPPIDYFPAAEKLRVNATLRRYAEPRIVRVDTVIEGLDYKPASPGVLQFEIDGKQHELEAYDAGGGELLIVFGDLTSGRGTYPAGRFLYAAKPGIENQTVLDFNTAQNPPCAFNEFATCPIASARNRLDTRIEAGEKYAPAH